MSGSGGVFADGTRLRILTDLVRDLLGPRDGPEELVRRDDPCALYLTAVLAPRPEQGDVPRSRDPEAEQAIPVNEVEFLSAEDDTDDAGEPGAFVAPPELDPAARPCGMGITFEVETDSRVSLDLCVTWARYLPEDDRQKPREWRRHPRVWVGDVTVGIGEARVVCLGPNGALPEQHPDCELSLHIRTRWVPGERRTRATVTLYLINRLQRRSSRTDPADHIFQPQLRVLSHPEPSPMRTPMTGGADREALVLELLHRHRAIRARGHMCSAVWREVDPERDPGTDAPPEQLEHLRALTWPDGAVLAREIRERFTAPHVRSEFIPVYAVLTSDAGWPEDLPSTPELRADVLAECWEPEELRRALEPLVRLFEQRVAEWKQEADRIALESRGYHDAVWHLFNQAGDAARRMRAGLELLLSDREARLAFCFSCRAVSLQHHWAGGEMAGPFRWRPFQLAFILSVLESIVRPDSYDRDALDLLWVPTGLGKTEAYLALMAFAIAYRRRRALRRRVGNGAGTAVISRYTLRLLTIQQFRRALRMITACEYLRVLGLRGGGPVGWRPARCNIRDQFIWGTARFAIGLWVGGNVTPNHLGSGPPSNPGAMYALKKPSGGGAHRGEPAQVLECPACGGVLAFDTLPQGVHTLSWLVEARSPQRILQAARRSPGHPAFEVLDVSLTRLADSTAAALEVRLSCGRDVLADEIHDWLETVLKGSGVQLTAHAGRPGYFIRRITGPKGGAHEIDFDIFCPRPRCPLNDGVLWAEGVPCDASAGPGADTGATQVYQLVLPRGQAVTSPDGLAFRTAPAFVRPGSGSHRTYLSVSVPIPALTVDEQIYRRCPSVVIATADKFARLSWEPRAASLFGNVDRFHPFLGYYRDGTESPAVLKALAQVVAPFEPPQLIIQDELHLLEGPLGSMFGLYEAVVDKLCARRTAGSDSEYHAKYIASTATIRQAQDQVESLFLRRLYVFPPHGLSWDDRFFLREREPHPLEEGPPGRLYVGVCAPGRGPLTPVFRIMARLLQSAHEVRLDLGDSTADPWWTLVAFFNAIRELAGARSLCRQDVQEWIRGALAGHGNPRPITEDGLIELSSRVGSTQLPEILSRLERRLPDSAPDILLTTSMFGTGVDVRRLSLMFVAGQPKTTSAYVQATGRVGRGRGGLVVTFLRVTRPRDLSHYEFFIGFHRRLHAFVEPVSVMPFSPQVAGRAGGPAAVALLRCSRESGHPWHVDTTAGDMRSRRQDEAWVAGTFEARAAAQPRLRRPDPGHVRQILDAALDRWAQASAAWHDLVYVEYCFGDPPQHSVVLGDAEHRNAGRAVYDMAPQSLRDVEDTVPVSTG